MRPMSGAGESVGERLRRLRRERGLSQRALATTGVSYAHISKIEVGGRAPSMKALRALAERLGVTVEYLETGRELRDPRERELRLGEAELILRLETDTAKADELFREALADAETAGDMRDAARARIGLAFVAAHRGDHDAAIAALERVVGEPWV